MGAVGLLGLSASRRRAGIPALSVAVLVLLCWDPWLARSAGFALSTLATLGLLLFAGTVEALPSGGGCRGAFAVGDRPSRSPSPLQLMCAPVIVLLQSSVSVVGVVRRTLFAPFVAPATVLGVATALLSVVSTTIAGWVAWPAALPTLAIARIAGSPRTRRWRRSRGPGRVRCRATGGSGRTAGRRGSVARSSGPAASVLPVGVAVLGVGAAVPTHAVTWPLDGWGFVACDVGQGDGLVLSTGPGRGGGRRRWTGAHPHRRA